MFKWSLEVGFPLSLSLSLVGDSIIYLIIILINKNSKEKKKRESCSSARNARTQQNVNFG